MACVLGAVVLDVKTPGAALVVMPNVLGAMVLGATFPLPNVLGAVVSCAEAPGPTLVVMLVMVSFWSSVDVLVDLSDVVVDATAMMVLVTAVVVTVVTILWVGSVVVLVVIVDAEGSTNALVLAGASPCGMAGEGVGLGVG